MRCYLISGPSGSGKTSVGHELKRRGFRVIDTDKEWAYLGDRKTRLPQPALILPSYSPEWFEQNAWLWDRRLVESSLQSSEHIIFCCGGADNDAEFFDLFDKVFMLDVNWITLKKRLIMRKNHITGTEIGLRYIHENFYVQRDISMHDLTHIESCGHSVEATANLIMSHIHIYEGTTEKLKRSIKAGMFRLGERARSIFPWS